MSTHATFGKYVLLRKLATGGMGEVFLAKQVGPSGFEKLLVIKRILAHHHEKREYLDMFLAEAKLVARLTHGNIIQIHEMGQIDGDYFIAMEYLRGKALRDIIDALRARGQTLPVPYVVDLAMKLCEGLGYAHAARDIRGRPMNIIHRDVNPHNVLISYAGDLKLIDFGIAKSEMASVHTATGTIKGKFVYMSPEQSAADPIDRRSDIFSLGIVLYEMTALENPFVRQNVVLSLEAIQRHPVPPVGEKRPDAGVLQPILDRALHKDPAERYQTCEEMRDDLRELLRLGKVKPAEQDLSIFLHDLFREDIEDEDRLLAEADRATSDDDGYTADLPSVGSSTVDELDDDVTRRGRPLAKDASPPPATPRPISEPPPRTPGPAIRTPVPIRAAPFSDEEPTIAGDLESLAIRSRMKSAAGLPQPEPTGQVLTLIPPEDVAPGTHEAFDDDGEPHTREDRVPSGAPDSIALVPRPQPTADMPAEAPGGIEAPSNRLPEAAFDELSSAGKPYDPRHAETKELGAGRSSVRDFEHADVPDTPVGVSTGDDLDSDRLEAEDPSVNLPVYGGSWRRSMVAAAVLVFALTAVAGYWLTRALTEPAAGPAPIPERTGPVPSELAGATPPVEPAPDPSPTPVNTVVPPVEPAEPRAPGDGAKPAPEPAADRVEAPKPPPRRSSRSSRAEARRKAREERAAARAARLEAAREAKAKARAAEAEALDRAAERAEAEAEAEAEAKARREAEAEAKAKAEAEARARREAEAKAKAEAARATPKEETSRPDTRSEPKAAPAGRRGILTLRSSAPVQVTHGSSAQGSAPSTILVRSNTGRVSLAGADVGLEIVLEYEVAEDGIRLRVQSEPWSIVKHNGISLGKTPQGPVEAGRRHRFSFLRPGLPEPVVVSLVWNPSSP